MKKALAHVPDDERIWYEEWDSEYDFTYVYTLTGIRYNVNSGTWYAEMQMEEQ